MSEAIAKSIEFMQAELCFYSCFKVKLLGAVELSARLISKSATQLQMIALKLKLLKGFSLNTIISLSSDFKTHQDSCYFGPTFIGVTM